MCGVLGLFNPNQLTAENIKRFKLANLSQKHRGPDGSGFFFNNYVALGHTRLSIIDIEGGAQPIKNNNSALVLVFNGEIYNYKALRTHLECKGFKFNTQSDAEVIVNAYESWGLDCVKYFKGMFSIIIYDSIKNNLFVARDRLGVKPLHYSLLNDGSIIFSSELKAIVTYANRKQKISRRSIADYFSFGYIPDPNTIYEGIYKVEAGNYLFIDLENPKVNPVQYWDLSFDTKEYSDSHIKSQLNSHLSHSVSLRMIADVPTGAFLSGGVDSSAVVSYMASLSKQSVETFSVSFNENEYDESRYALEVSKINNTKHHSEVFNENDLNFYEKLYAVYDEPFADSSALPTLKVCQLASQSVKVVLTGDGAD